MKKTLVFLTFFTAMLFTSGHTHAEIGFGIKAGYNASKLSASIDSIKSSINSGFHAGVFMRIGKRVHLQPELYYTFSGATFETSGINTVNDWKQEITVGTLDIPVLIGFTIIESKLLKWRIDVGPEVSFLVNSKVENVTLAGPIEKSDMQTTNWFIQAGTGIDVWFLTLDVRYQAGLNSLIGDVTGNDGTVYPVNTKGNSFVVSLGFKIF
jgi:hypothetical protein